MTSSSSPSQDAQTSAQNYPEGLRADALMEEDVAWSHEIDGDRDGEQFERSERAALRRVAGLSTELEDVTEVEYRQLRLERVVLVGVWTSGTIQDADNSLAELAALAETAGALVLDGLVQRRDKPDAATYIGSGKANELRDIVIETGADTVICDGELSPGQLIHLEDVVKVKVIDRTALILDIFAQHAKSREGKAQVALAQMQYMLPRLRGWGQSLSRQMGGGKGGGLATRGPGETKIETDRRRIREKMAKMRREIAEMKTGREIKRQERRRNKVPSVAIAGYTNSRQVVPAQPPHRRGRPRRERAVRDPRPDRAPGRDPERAAVHAGRHGRIRTPSAAPPGRGVPLHHGGGRRLRPDPARRGRFASGTGGAAGRGPRGHR